MRLNADKVEEEIVIPEPKFSPVYNPPVGILPNGWSEPPSSEDFVMPSYPFHIQRTKNKPNGAVGFLPIYSDIRYDSFFIYFNAFWLISSHLLLNTSKNSIGGTKKTTIIRKVTGDTDLFVSEMGIALGMPENELNESVRIRTGGNIEVNGLHMNRVRKWLVGLGF